MVWQLLKERARAVDVPPWLETWANDGRPKAAITLVSVVVAFAGGGDEDQTTAVVLFFFALIAYSAGCTIFCVIKAFSFEGRRRMFLIGKVHLLGGLVGTLSAMLHVFHFICRPTGALNSFRSSRPSK